ncbi:hypothetical protein GCM10007079_14360 [Nocardiopsis terrae]|uniref:RDD family membrane protein YckC n=1 Tax=Nocardiopsis terrae TaxID=372655 RepID=A0ABR9HBG4_9ACTN|nr:hypothetical protein [Nocardiopsis terrae]MBE1456361.1 putative RDD family membrane protein YckC [Nocardiopsis terrae]GHC77296.1 hypothetical protein GCM10007079_14360 [Nocardiopsis terrae]
MSRTPPVSPRQALLLGLVAGAGATLLSLLIAWFYLVLVVEVSDTGVLGVDADELRVTVFVTLTAAPLLAWLLLRLLGLPHPLPTALLSVPLYLVYAALPLTEYPVMQHPLWGRTLGLFAMTLAVTLPVLVTSSLHRRRAAPPVSPEDDSSDPRA